MTPVPDDRRAESRATMEADFTEEVVPTAHRRPNFRILATFLSMQVVFGAVLVGYTARFGRLQAWLTGAVVYVVEVALVARRATARSILGYARIGEEPAPADVQPATAPA